MANQLNSRLVFIAMPFLPEFDVIYELVIKPVLRERGLKPWRADKEKALGIVLDKVSLAIKESEFIIANITGSYPNVMYEVGKASGLGKQCILIAEEGSEIPTLIKALEYISYSNPLDLKDKLSEFLNGFQLQLNI